jgi:hypothetical protein
LVELRWAWAQQSATVAGTIEAPDALPENARIGVHIVDENGVWGREIGTTTPSDGRFSVELAGTAEPLGPFRSGDVVLPGLQNDYSLEPDVNFTRAQVNVYLDETATAPSTAAPTRRTWGSPGQARRPAFSCPFTLTETQLWRPTGRPWS